MKKILPLLLLTVFAITTHAQTDEAMLKWLNGHVSAINLAKSETDGEFFGLTGKRAIRELKFTQSGIDILGTAAYEKGIMTRLFFLKATIDNELLVLHHRLTFTMRLHIEDAGIREKYKEVFTRFAYTRLNTNETDLPVYESSTVDTKAAFPGGEEAWRQFVGKYFFMDPAIKYEVPPGKYQGVINFVVTKDSIIKDFKKEPNSPKGIQEAMLYVALKMPRWVPATLNGKNVSSTATIKMTIVVPVLTNSLEDQMWKAEALKYRDRNFNTPNYANGNSGYIGLTPLNLDDNNTPAPTKTDNDVKNPVTTKEKTTYVNPERKKLEVQTSTLFRDIELFSEGYAAVAYGKDESSKKWGFIDNTGKLIIKPKYTSADFFSGGLAPVELNDQYGYIDKTGAVKIPFIYRWAGSFRDGLAKVWNGDKIGFIDPSGTVVIELKYDEASDFFNEGMAGVKKDKKWGFINTDGTVVVPIKYDYVSSFYDGLARVILNKKYGFINKKGEEIIPLKYDGTYPFSEGLAQVELNKKYGFIDKSGNEVIPIKYDNTGLSFQNGSVDIEANKMKGLIDRTGNPLTPIKYDVIDKFSEGLAQFWLDDKKGFINHQGQEVIPAKYRIAGKFSEGLARVYINGKWGYINKEDKLVIPARYDDADDFLGGLAPVVIKGQKFIINKTGQKIIPKLQ